MSSSIAVTQLFQQLKHACSDIEEDAKSLKRNITSNTTSHPTHDAQGEGLLVDSLLGKLREMTTEASSIRSNLTGTKSGVKSTGVATLSDILAKCMAVYDSNNQVKDSIRAYSIKFKSQTIENEIKNKIVSFANDNNDYHNDSDIENMENGLQASLSAVAAVGSASVVSTDETSKKSERTILGEITIDQQEASDDVDCEAVYIDSVDSSRVDADVDVDRDTVENIVEINENSMKSPMNTTSDDHLNEIHTPVMFDWKLSDATRNLVKNTSFLVPANRRNTLIGLADLELLSDTKPDHQVSEEKSEIKSRYQTPQQLLKSCHLLESSPTLSKAVDCGAETPVTPTIGTPFQTVNLQLTASKCNIDENLLASLDESSQASPAAPTHALTHSPTPSSTPVTTQVMPPISSGFDAAIPAVDHEEWIRAPSFLKLQLTMDVLNQAINEINGYIAQEDAEIFTQDQMDAILCDAANGLNLSKGAVKAVMLGLVTLKKIDLGTEGKNKVYKIKK